MSLLPSGYYMKSTAAYRLMVASSPTFQELVGVGNESDALQYVIVGGLYETSIPETARVLTRPSSGTTLEMTSDTGFEITAEQELTFEFPIPKAHKGNFTDTTKWLLNKVGDIVAEMLQACRERADEMPDVMSVTDEIMPGLYDPDEHDGRWIGVAMQGWTSRGELTWS